ncbi:ABC transporter permease [Candidatus Micrarchaeota archaeon]|nr:ABC transporter permease [Candidatus Micrarchaeota archaeon]
MSFLSDAYTIWAREMIRFWRQRARVISSLAMPFFWLVFIGYGFGGSLKLPGMDYTKFLAPGVVGMSILFTGLFTGLSVIWERQFGFLKEMMVAPVSRTSIMLGKTLGGATIAVLNGLVMYIIASAMGMIDFTIALGVPLVFMALTALCFVSIGLMMASRMRNFEAFQALMTFLIVPTMFLSGSLFPLASTPGWMQAVSYADPLTYGVDGLRGALLGASYHSLWVDFWLLSAFAVFFLLLGAHYFRKSAN